VSDIKKRTEDPSKNSRNKGKDDGVCKKFEEV